MGSRMARREWKVPRFPGTVGVREQNFTAEMTLGVKDGERVELVQGPRAGGAWELGRGRRQGGWGKGEG